jgi:protein-L-isoaspartate(D-aspartate) O-methyltransferase
MNFDTARFNMVEQQIRPWDVLDPKVLQLFMDTPRHLFVPSEHQHLAYMDLEVPLAHGQVMLPPKVEARMLQAVDIDENERVLEVGTGSGFMTALLAKLSRDVTTVEYYADLSEQARAKLSDFDSIKFEVGDAACDWNDGQQYDVIILTGSSAEVPQAHLRKLNLGGRLICTTGESPLMETWLIARVEEENFEYESLFETEIPPLIHCEPKPHFEF